MSWPDADVGWAVAFDEGTTTQLLVHTTDAGASWSPVPIDVGEGMQVLFADVDDGWVIGTDGVQSTHDGGTSWSAVTLPDAGTGAVGVAAANGIVHAAYVSPSANGIRIASSPVDHDAFVAAEITIPFGAGPALDMTMSAGGPYGELVYNDRTLTGAAEIRDGKWVEWDLTCPYENPFAIAGLSPQGEALAISCGASGFGDPAPIVGANLTRGTIEWVTIEPAEDVSTGGPTVGLVAATDAGTRIVTYTAAGGQGVVASSTDGGATWQARTLLPNGENASSIAHLPDGSLLLALHPSGGLVSPDGVNWTAVATHPIG